MNKLVLYGSGIVLALLGVGYLGFQVVEAVTPAYTRGEMSIPVGVEGKPQSVPFVACAPFLNAKGQHMFLVTDGQENGIRVTMVNGVATLDPFLEQMSLPLTSKGCTLIHSDLRSEEAQFTVKKQEATTTDTVRWNGSLEATCDTTAGKVAIQFAVRLCQ